MLNELYTFAEPVQVVPFSSLKWGKFTLLHTLIKRCKDIFHNIFFTNITTTRAKIKHRSSQIQAMQSIPWHSDTLTQSHSKSVSECQSITRSFQLLHTFRRISWWKERFWASVSLCFGKVHDDGRYQLHLWSWRYLVDLYRLCASFLPLPAYNCRHHYVCPKGMSYKTLQNAQEGYPLWLVLHWNRHPRIQTTHFRLRTPYIS